MYGRGWEGRSAETSYASAKTSYAKAGSKQLTFRRPLERASPAILCLRDRQDGDRTRVRQLRRHLPACARAYDTTGIPYAGRGLAFLRTRVTRSIAERRDSLEPARPYACGKGGFEGLTSNAGIGGRARRERGIAKPNVNGKKGASPFLSPDNLYTRGSHINFNSPTHPQRFLPPGY